MANAPAPAKSWADEMEDEELPVFEEPKIGSGSSASRAPHRPAFQSREKNDRAGGDRNERGARGDRDAGSQDWRVNNGGRNNREYDGDRRGPRGGNNDYHGRDNRDRNNNDRYNQDRNRDRPANPDRTRPRVYTGSDDVLPTEAPFTAYIGNLTPDTTVTDLELLFKDQEVQEIRLSYEQKTNQFKGFGYVDFKTLDSLKEGLKLHGQPVKANKIFVDVGKQRAKETREAASSSAPTVRPKLVLEPRSKEMPKDIPEQFNYSKSNIFGNAKPRDEAAIQKAKEEERLKREADAAVSGLASVSVSTPDLSSTSATSAVKEVKQETSFSSKKPDTRIPSGAKKSTGSGPKDHMGKNDKDRKGQKIAQPKKELPKKVEVPAAPSRPSNIFDLLGQEE